MRHLKNAVRTLIKTPFLTGVAVASLALGIGANAAIYSLFDQILLRSLPVQEPDRLVNLSAPGPKPGSQSCNQAGGCDVVFSYPMFRDLQDGETGFAGLAAHRLFGVNLAAGDRTANGSGLLVSGNYFQVLGVQPALGRLFSPADDAQIGAHFVTVLSHRYWENDLGADPSVLNSTLEINGKPMTVIGVAAAGFEGSTLGSQPDVFVPVTMRTEMIPTWDGFDGRRSYWLYLFGRLEPGLEPQQADERINTLYGSIVNEVEAPLQEGMTAQTLERFQAKQVVLEPGFRGQSSMHAEAETPLMLLFATTGFVLLIACANIANLLLARGAQRGQEIAIRASLGAGRGRLLRQLLTESLVLALMGGLASLLVAQWTLTLMGRIMPPEAVPTLDLAIDPSVIGFAALLSIGTGFLFGFYPAIHNTRLDLVSRLKANTGQPSGSRAAQRFRAGLVTAQIALSLALLASAGLFLKSLANVSRVDLGLQSEGVVTFAVSPALNGYEAERNMALFRETEAQLAALPGVRSVSASMVPVLTGSSWGTDVSVEGFEWEPDLDANSRYNEVGPGFFGTLGIPLVAGREFDDGDVEGAPEVAVINEAFARKFGLEPREAVGRFMATGGSGQSELPVRIVGVIQDAAYSSVKDEVPATFYTPYRQDTSLRSMSFYVQTAIDPGEVLQAVPPLVARIDPNLPLEDLKTLDQQISESVFLDRFISILSASFAVLATLLAAVGLYGVLAYTVAQRTREIGLRMALGAESSRVRQLVLRQVMRMLVVGGLVGMVGAVLLGRLAESLLYGMQGTDLLVLTVTPLLLAVVALGAGYLPAHRASRVDPMEALRYE